MGIQSYIDQLYSDLTKMQYLIMKASQKSRTKKDEDIKKLDTEVGAYIIKRTLEYHFH